MAKKNNPLGRSLIKDRFGNKSRKVRPENFLHTSELKDGYDWNRLNLQSVTEQDSFQEFLLTAELAGTEFAAEKLNVAFINPRSTIGLLSKEETRNKQKLHEENKNLLQVPRRPKWDSNTSADELQANERQIFLEWRRKLTLFQEETGLLITPYEKNLDFWRQLWRVVERCDVLVQIVDARNPLLFRCEDLEKYVKETDKKKCNLILCNKGDFLTKNQRHVWAKYFTSVGVNVVFFSAIESDKSEEGSEENINEIEETSDINEDDDDNYLTEEEEEIVGIDVQDTVYKYDYLKNSSKLFTREELVEFFRKYKETTNKELVTIGLVGYPNVGKSSTINALLTYKKVPVSATPGKTKHFQTVYLDKDILLCDCPGLVMPSFVLTKADMILNGILPIDQMKDHVPPINLLCRLIPKHVLEDKYAIMIPRPEEGENADRPPFSEELLNPYAYNRGFMTANGQPDNARAARYILKDFVNGKLLYCYSPTNFSQSEYHTFPEAPRKTQPPLTIQAMRAIKANKMSAKDVDNRFFCDSDSKAHNKGALKYDCNGILKVNSLQNKNDVNKPWKNHKEKRNKHVKARIKYRYLDE